MTIHAYKYQGAGNDFVILDNRDLKYNNLTPEQIKLLCDRRFGVGSDGLMLLGPSDEYDFSMRYFNADGYEGSMCGNGGRCLVAFAAHMGIKKFEFNAIDGYHHAEVLELGKHRCIVKLRMIDLGEYQKYSDNAYFLNTGSPHYVEFVDNVMEYPVDEKGKYWRWHKDFKGGTNVNFVEICDNKIKVRTYERGVEAETFACGTGVTASSIATYLHNTTKGFACRESMPIEQLSATDNDNKNNLNAKQPASELERVKYDIQALGDSLSVSFDYTKSDKKFTNIYLTGPATFVFETDIEI